MRRLLIVFVVLLGACKTAELTRTAGYTVSDSAGIEIVVNREPLWTAGAGWRIDSVPSTVVGRNDADVQQQFQYVMGTLRLANGNVLVATMNDLRLFGADGKFIKLVARDGNGPGEFRSISAVVRVEGDTVIAMQSQAEGGTKLVVFNPDGSFAREERPDPARFRALGRWSECRSMLFPDRSRLGCQHDPTIPETASNRPSRLRADGLSSPGPGHLRRLQRLHIIPASLDTSYRIGIDGGIEQFGVSINGKEMGFMTHPFYATSHIHAGGEPLRIATITNPDYEVRVWTSTGKLERIIRRTNGRRAPTAAELTDVPDQIEKRYAGHPGRDSIRLKQMIAAVPTPDSLPAAQGLIVGEAGEILVAREGHLPSHQHMLYDVFDARGRWQGEFRLPRRSYIREIGADYLLIVRYDDDDVPSVHVHRLHK